MSLGGSLKGILAGVAMIVAAGATDVAAQQPEEKEASYDTIMATVDNIEVLQFQLDHGYSQEVKKNVGVPFASHFPGGEAITQTMYEVAASMAKKTSAPQVVIMVVRDPEEALTLRAGNRFSNTEYEQKIIDMAKNVSNSFGDPQAKVKLMLAIAQEDGISTDLGAVYFYINDRIVDFSPTSDAHKDMDESSFIREVAANLWYQFNTGHYKFTKAQLAENVTDEGRLSRGDTGSSSSSGDTGDAGGDSDQSVSLPVFADNSM